MSVVIRRKSSVKSERGAAARRKFQALIVAGFARFDLPVPVFCRLFEPRRRADRPNEWITGPAAAGPGFFLLMSCRDRSMSRRGTSMHVHHVDARSLRRMNGVHTALPPRLSSAACERGRLRVNTCDRYETQLMQATADRVVFAEWA